MSAQPKHPYQGFIDLCNCSLAMGGKQKPYELIARNITGYKVDRVSDVLHYRFNLLVPDHLKHTIVSLDDHRLTYRMELVFLLFRVTQHVLQTILPTHRIKDEQCYDFLQRMSSSIHSDSDMEAALLQFCIALPTDDSIRSNATTLKPVWPPGQQHHPAVLLEMISSISSLKTAKISPWSDEQHSICRSILTGLQDFHLKSGSRRSILFTQRHLNLSDRVARNSEAPQFWYQCLLGRIAQIWLTRSYTAAVRTSGKRKAVVQCPAIYNHAKENVPPNTVLTNSTNGGM